MWRLLAVVALLGCKQPKQPLQASYFSAKKPEGAPLTCKENLDCYAQCQPLIEECMLRCDQRGSEVDVERARAVANCAAANACTDRACEDERCGAQIHACTTSRQFAAPSPMQPAPVRQPQPMHTVQPAPPPASRGYPPAPPPRGYPPPPPARGYPPPPRGEPMPPQPVPR